MRHKAVFSKKRFWFFLLIPLVLYLILPDSIPENGKRVISVFSFATIFWAFEVLPLWITSLWVVLSLSFLTVSPEGVRQYGLFFTSFSNPLILLFFGGFVLASTLRKHRVDEYILVRVLQLAGSNSYAILAATLSISAFFSMWISNTAAAAMVLALTKPLFQGLSKTDPMRKGLPLAIAFGCNIGGMGTPIGTPPNAIVLGILREVGIRIDFLSWMMMVVPLVVLILVFVFLLLICLFPPKEKKLSIYINTDLFLSKEAAYVGSVAGFMILLWLTEPFHGISESWVALLGVALLTSLRLSTLGDIKRIDWDILLLMCGGLALGTAIEKSEILISSLSVLSSYNDLIVIIGFCMVTLLLSTFLSNTATANLLLPFAAGISSVEASLIAIPVALTCSLGMSLPVSTPPNALAYSYGALKTMDFIKTGVTVGIGGLILILIGFKWIIPWFV